MAQDNNGAEKPTIDGSLVAAQVESLAELERHWSSVLANASALVMDSMADLNWAGFYLMRGGRLALVFYEAGAERPIDFEIRNFQLLAPR